MAINIDMGHLAINRNDYGNYGITRVDKLNPSNADGEITSVEIYVNTAMTGVEVATFYVVSGNNLSTRDHVNIGSLSVGYRQINVNLEVKKGDYIGIYFTSGRIDINNAGSNGYWYIAEDHIPCINIAFNPTPDPGLELSLRGTGTAEVTTGSIYIGSPAIDGTHYYTDTDTTRISGANPADGNGKITLVEIYAYTTMTQCEIAIFRQVSANVFTVIDSILIGNIYAGTKRCFAVNLDVEEGDYIGIYFATGQIELNTGTYPGNWALIGDNIPCTEVTFDVSPTTIPMSLCGTGYILIKPSVTTNEVTGIRRVDPSKVDANGNVTDDGSEGDEKILKRGFKYGLTETDTWYVEEEGSFDVGVYSLEITGLDPDTIYYVRAYADNIKGRSFGAYVQFKTAVPYWSKKIEIKAEATASAEDIAKVGGKKTLTINNHLIQNMSIAQNIANAYLAEYKDQKEIIVVNRPIPLPYEIGDTIRLKRRII